MPPACVALMPVCSEPRPVVDVDAEGVHPRLVIGLLALQLLFLLQLLLKRLAVCILRKEIAQVTTACICTAILYVY